MSDDKDPEDSAIVGGDFLLAAKVLRHAAAKARKVELELEAWRHERAAEMVETAAAYLQGRRDQENPHGD